MIRSLVAQNTRRRRHIRHPSSKIGFAKALVFMLTGCAINIEPTDLSAVTIKSDRAAIEQALGEPEISVEELGFTVASYTYDKGYYDPTPYKGALSTDRKPLEAATGGIILVAWPVILPIALAAHNSKVERIEQRQKAKLTAIYDSNNKLLFAGSTEGPNPTSDSLAALADRYAKAHAGDPDALVNLGKTSLIPGQRLTFLETASNTGSAEAAFELGEMYKLGAGVEQSDQNAFKNWLEAAQRSHAPAYIKLGRAYQTGVGVERDLDQARYWYAKAAIPPLDVDTPEGQYRLALAFENGELIPTNFPEAEQLLKESAEAGYVPAQSLYGTRILPNNPVEALKWHEVAATAGYGPAQTELGRHYLEGRAVKRNRAKARSWFEQAAKAGERDAVQALATMAANEAQVETLLVDAQQGDAKSQQKLGYAYQIGQGVEYDMQQALYWYERAAENGDVDSQYLLGWLHQNGTDVEHDAVTALKWYSIAKPNYPVAVLRTDSLKAKMTPAQITEAESLAHEWIEAHPQ